MQFPSTRPTLLNNLNSDEAAWTEFFRRYQPVVADLGKFKGLTDSECDDLVQIVMIRFNRKVISNFKFDPALAKFRTFFCCLIKGCIYDLLRQRNHSPLALEEIPEASSSAAPDELLDMVMLEKWRKIVQDEAFALLAEKVGEKTYQAFMLYAVKNCPVKEVCKLLQISRSSVYTAKSRCIDILQQIIKDLNQRDPELCLDV